MGAFEAWPSIKWTVLSGPRCTKWTKVVQKTVLVGRELRVSCYGVSLKPGLVLCGLYQVDQTLLLVGLGLWGNLEP